MTRAIDGQRLQGLKLIAVVDADRKVAEGTETDNVAVASRTFGKGIGFTKPPSVTEGSGDAKKGKGKGGKKGKKGKKGGKKRR